MVNFNQPMFVTLTGVDDKTDLKELRDLNSEFSSRVEWGVLLSKKRMGEERYPSLKTVARLVEAHLDLSFHLCGEYARLANKGETVGIEGLVSPTVRRLQINLREPYDLERCSLLRFKVYRPIILQSRLDEMPNNNHFDWLFDRSGGKGIRPDSWPRPIGRGMCGFAGGIGPDNVVDVILELRKKAATGAWFWVDMESSLREDGKFSLKKCRKVLMKICELQKAVAA